MTNSITLKNLLEIENTPQLIQQMSPNNHDIPIWPIIRSTFLRILISKMYYTEPLISKGNRLVQKAKCIYYGIEHTYSNRIALGEIGKQEILISTSGSRYQNINGKLFNILSDYFYDALPVETLIIESFDIGFSPNQRYCKKLISNNPFYLTANIPQLYLRKSTENRIRILLESVSSRAETFTGVCLTQSEVQWLLQYTVHECGRLERLRTTYYGLFKALKSKLLLLQCAGAGGADAVAMILAARDRGVVVAEFQHGLITEGNDAYNYSDAALMSDEYVRTLPDFTLTYGKAWCSRSNSPSKKIAIGNPFRDEAKRLFSNEVTQKLFITVLGDGIDTDATLDLCYRISLLNINNCIIQFRPHPTEKSKLKNRTLRNIKIDLNSNVYTTLYSTAILIGEVSTVLYEAIGIVDKIILWETPKSQFFDPHAPFIRLKSLEQISDLFQNIYSKSTYVIDATEALYWSSNWISNYRNFAKDLLQ